MIKNKWGIKVVSLKDGSLCYDSGKWSPLRDIAIPFGGKISLLDARVEFINKSSAIAAAKAYTDYSEYWIYKAEKRPIENL